MNSSPPLQRAQRLRAIAQELGIVDTIDESQLTLPTYIPSFHQPEDDQRLEATLEAVRQEESLSQHQPRGFARAFSSGKKQDAPYTPQELHAALRRTVERNESAGVAEKIIARLGGVQSSKLTSKRSTTNLFRRSQSDARPTTPRTRLLQTATELERHDFVQVLAPHAHEDQESLDESLSIALTKRDLPIIETLLRFSADASRCEAQFVNAASVGDAQTVGLLLRSRKRPSQNCINNAQLQAVTSGSLPTVFTLARLGASGDHDGARSLLYVAGNGRNDLAVAIIMGLHPPSSSLVDKAVEMLLSDPNVNMMEKLLSVDILLCGNPAGHAVNEGLIKATWMGCQPMMQLLLEGGASINYKEATALKHAISRQRVDQIRILLRDGGLENQLASEAVSRLPSTAPPEVKVAIISMLLHQGATGNNLHELLIQSMEQGDLETARILTSYGSDQGTAPVVSVDYSGARSLQIAVSRANVDAINILLQVRPSKYSLAAVFPLITATDPDHRFQIMRALLHAGAAGHEVDATLHTCVVSQSIRFIELLVQYRAKVTAETLFEAVSQGSTTILRILFQGNPQPEICSAAIPHAMKIPVLKSRFHTIKILLGQATKGDKKEISQAVLDVLKKSPGDLPLLRLLCEIGRADVNIQDGITVSIAASLPDPAVLYTILLSDLTPKTVTTGLTTILSLPPATAHRQQKLEVFLRKGKDQDVINHALVQEVRLALVPREDNEALCAVETIETLLNAGADVNYSGGASVCHAVRDAKIMDLVLARKPTQHTLSQAFPLAVELQDKEARYIVTTKLLRAGLVGEELSKALCHVIKEGAEALPFIRLIIPQANVNYSEGLAIRRAVRKAFTEAVSLMIKQRATTATLRKGFEEAMKLKGVDERRQFVEIFLQAGVKGEVVSEALATSVSLKDEVLCETLLKAGASVDHRQGQAVISAASSGNTALLRSLIDGNIGPRPTLSTLTAGFGASGVLRATDKEAFINVQKALLECGMRGEAVDEELIQAVQLGDANIEKTKLLINHGASVESRDGFVLELAAKLAAVETLSLLISSQPSQNSLKRAFRAAALLPKEQRLPVVEIILNANKVVDKHVSDLLLRTVMETPADHKLIKVLTNHGVFDEGVSMFHAATVQDMETLKILAGSSRASDFASNVFQDAWAEKKLQQSNKGLAIISLLLETGATGVSVNTALVETIERAMDMSQPLAEELIDILIPYADVNHQHGLSVRRAAGAANLKLLQSLLPKANSETVSMAFPYLFRSPHSEDETEMLKMIRVFQDSVPSSEGLTDNRHPDPDLQPVLFMALQKFPRKTEIVKALIEAGCNPNQWMMYEADAEVGLEQWTILCWALNQPEKRISDGVIEQLIKSGANTTSCTKSGSTPLRLCIANNRPTILRQLLDSGVKPEKAKLDSLSSLALASALGRVECMDLLLEAHAEQDDGSLHDAARKLELDSMRILLKHHHEPDFPSERHEGRSALAELCLHAPEDAPLDLLEEAVMVLISNDATIRLRDTSGKTMFHYALDSANPVPILRVLLKLCWKIINEEVFLFDDGTYTYSLTKYVEKDLYKGPEAYKTEILQILKQMRARDRFWATDPIAIQPPDMVDAPQSIKDEVVRQKLRQKHQSEMKEDLHLQLELKQLAAVKENEIHDNQNSLAIRRNLERSRAQRQIKQDEADLIMQLENRTEQDRQRRLMIRQQQELEHTRRTGQLQIEMSEKEAQKRIDMQGTEQLLKIEYASRLRGEEQAGLKSRLAIEEQGLRQRGQIEKTQREDLIRDRERWHEKEMARMKVQRQLVDRMGEAGRGMAAAGVNQRQIGYIMGEVNN